MQYRKIPKTGQELSALGFGCMRLPICADGKIDEPTATRMLHYAIDHGVNYVDTAWAYHDGASEPFVGRALRSGYREKVNLATKLPSWLIKNRQDLDSFLEQQLERLQTDHIDYYLLHALDSERWSNLSALGMLDFLETARNSGKIRYAGFSFHDRLDLFKEIIDAYDWTFCQIQYNLLDENEQAGTEGLQYAAARNIGVIVMEPLRGGKLTTNIPQDVKKIWAASPNEWSPAQWALRWVWNHPEVTVVLSGMTTLEQLTENVAIAQSAEAGSLSNSELAVVERVKRIYRDRIQVPCTGCKYCLPCPNGVDIPECFHHYNNAHMFNDLAAARRAYGQFLTASENAVACIECGQCLEACPQAIQIPAMLKKVHEVLG